MERREIGRFLARSDDGQEVEIVEYRDVHLVPRLGSNPPAEVEGASYYETDDGEDVSPLDGGRYYEVVLTGVIYRCVDV